MSKVKPQTEIERRYAEARARARASADAMTDEEDARLTAAALADPDNPPLGDNVRMVPAYLAKSRGGRPRIPTPKVPVNIRLDAEIVAFLKAGGEGWQTRLNAMLREAVAKARGAAQAGGVVEREAPRRSIKS